MAGVSPSTAWPEMPWRWPKWPGPLALTWLATDWGASLAWYLAGHFPERVRSLSALSVPHPRALLEAMGTSRQALHSWSVLFLQLPWVPEILLRRVGEHRLVTRLRGSGLGDKAATMTQD